jgi:glycine cleavage system H protein
MPVSGKVEEVNPALADDPAAVNKDPYGAGWIVKVKIKDAGQIKGLLSADQYTAAIG